VRRSALAFARWMAARFDTVPESAACVLGLAPRTLERWRTQWTRRRLAARPRGRPAQRVNRETRREIIAALRENGSIGVPALAKRFPGVARRELEDLARRWRRAMDRRGRDSMLRLSWTRPGTVWAMDHTQAPAPIDGLYSHVLLVRDLASGEQLAAVPTIGQRAEDVVRVLWALFELHGPPLVLKHDNGPGFIAQIVQLLLACYGVLSLRSPPYYPRYNGSCEAGVGSLSRRTERLAAAEGRPGWWTSDDLERARLEANATALPHGPRGPTPDAAWQSRPPLESLEREAFLATYRQQLGERLRAWETREGGSPAERDRASIERQAIAGALADLNLLTYRRRPITPRDHPA
jgi:hypothetical protein